MDEYIPKKSFKPNPKKHTFPSTPDLLSKIHRKRVAFKTYKKYPTKSNYNIYAKLRNQVKWESRKALKQKEKKIALDSKNNPKALYQYVYSKTKTKENISN